MHHQEVARKVQLANDFQLVLDLGICRAARGSGGPYRSRAPVITRCRSQLSSVWPVGHVERRQLRRDERQPERALLAEVGGGRHHLRAVREQPRHLLSRAQVRTTQRGNQPAASSIELRARMAPIAMANRPRDGSAKCAAVVATTPHAEPRRQRGQGGVALVVAWVAVMGQLDAHPGRAEPVHQIGERRLGRVRAAGRQALGAHGLCGIR